MNDSLRRDDIKIFGSVTSKPSKSRRKAKSRVLYCALVDGRYASHFHSKKHANRAIRLLKHYGKDAYLGNVTI